MDSVYPRLSPPKTGPFKTTLACHLSPLLDSFHTCLPPFTPITHHQLIQLLLGLIHTRYIRKRDRGPLPSIPHV
jgi:hypothetical protein